MGLYWRIEKKIRELESGIGFGRGCDRRTLCRAAGVAGEGAEGTILDDVYIPMQVVRQGRRVVFDARARAWDAADLGADGSFRGKFGP